jgi:DNA-binding NarL/FixJ family response regulator
MDMQSTERVHAVAQAATMSANLTPRPTGLIVAERRDFFRGCLSHWLGQFSDEFQTLALPDLETTQDDAPLKAAAAILIGAGRAERADGWLSRQVEWLRARCPEVPIALLMEAPDPSESRAVETIARQFGVQGCITTSTSLNVAVAALRLVVAGGQYFPTSPHVAQPSEIAAAGGGQQTMAGSHFEKLTPRELAVLSVLAVGAQNKIIAYRLGMSMSTVKAHMHSIIRKLHVRNRTEAVVAARAMELTPRNDEHGVLTQAA